MTNYLEKTDADLKIDVLSELEYEPSVQIADIGILVRDGTVTLNGYATSYNERWEAVRAVKRVAGVKAIADDIQVKLPDSVRRTDGDIATAAVNQIDWSTTILPGTVQVTVRDGWVVLEGEVDWLYLKNTVGKLVQHLSGVKGLSNLITIKPTLTVTEVESALKSAFKRNALLDVNSIRVETLGNKVILQGKVRNYAELEEAERVAWAVPGVFSVDNQLTVNWSSFRE